MHAAARHTVALCYGLTLSVHSVLFWAARLMCRAEQLTSSIKLFCAVLLSMPDDLVIAWHAGGVCADKHNTLVS